MKRHPSVFLLFPLGLAGVFHSIFYLFHAGTGPQTTALGMGFLFILVVILTKIKREIDLPAHVYWLELAFSSLFFLMLLCAWGARYSSYLSKSPRGDIGFTTERAVQRTVNRENPYQPTHKKSSDPKLRKDYKYGPGMLLGYLPSGFFPKKGFKTMNLIYLIGILFCVGYLSWQSNGTLPENLATMMFTCLLTIIPERIPFEFFKMGVNDAFSIFLLLLCLVFMKNEKGFWAGACAGLSFSAKFSPAIFFIALFIRKDFRRNFFWGLAAGLSPNLIYLIWDAPVFLERAYFYHVQKKYDATSLYSLTPGYLHFLFGLIQLAALVVFMVKNASKEWDLMDFTTSFVLLLTLEVVAYLEIHTNHLTWFVPFLALILARSRYKPAALF